jgi:hypothetical protein
MDTENVTGRIIQDGRVLIEDVELEIVFGRNEWHGTFIIPRGVHVVEEGRLTGWSLKTAAKGS